MWSFLAELVERTDQTITVLIMEEGSVDPPRRHQVRPRRILLLWGGSLLVAILLTVGIVGLTPLRGWLPGANSEAMQQKARINAMRVTALADSLHAQQQYIRHLRGLITGRMDSTRLASAGGREAPTEASPTEGEDPGPVAETSSDDWADHVQPALPVIQSDTKRAPQPRRPAARLQLPVRPPVQGIPTRGFDARAGHYAIDIAAEEGSQVRSIGDGYVILADWTQDGGYTIAVQHAEGYTSVYKHNKRLLRRVGDRVRGREVLATSGNTGEVTTGPHLHFELWRDGLAQNPQHYVVGW